MEYDVARKLGIQGGYMFIHNVYIECLAPNLIRRAVSQSGLKRKSSSHNSCMRLLVSLLVMAHMASTKYIMYLTGQVIQSKLLRRSAE